MKKSRFRLCPNERTDARDSTTVRIGASESFTMGHIHRAPRGENGSIVRFLFPNLPENEELEARGFPTRERLRVEGEGNIAPALDAEICARPEQFYVNFHTTQFPAGAIRGQLR